MILFALYLHVGAGLERFGGYNPGWTQPWRMYHNYGIRICEVKYFDMQRDPDTPIDRLKTFNTSLFKAGNRDKRVRDKKGIKAQALRLCPRLKTSDLRAEARCASHDGWRQAMNREQNLCKSEKRR